MHSHYLELCVLNCSICSNPDHPTIRRVSLRLIHFPQPFRLNYNGAQLLQKLQIWLVAHWTAAYNTPALPIIEALAGLSGAKGEPHSSLDKESGTVLALPG